MEEPLWNYVAFCNNPIPKDKKSSSWGTSFCLLDNVAKPLLEQSEVSPDTENFAIIPRYHDVTHLLAEFFHQMKSKTAFIW